MKVKLLPWQQEVVDDKHRFKILCAGRRAGKSVLARMETLRLAADTPGRYWIVNPTRVQGKKIHWPDLKREVPSEWIAKVNESELSIELKNGSVISIQGADYPDALRGVALRHLVVDEVASIRNWSWLWQEVLRPTLSDYEAPAIFISTPKGFNHFYDLFEMGQVENESFKSWKFTTFDNPRIPVGEIENAKKELTEDTFYQEYLADFRKYTGLVYKYFERDTNVIPFFDIPYDWRVYRGMDFGTNNPTACVWVAQDGDSNFYIIDEYYERSNTIDYHSGVINSNRYNKQVEATYADPSGAQWIKEFQERGIYATPATKEANTTTNSWVRLGIDKISELLKRKSGHFVPYVQRNNDALSSADRDVGMPKLFIFDTCVNVIREFESYRWREKSVTQAQDLNEPDIPEKANDHALDALRYVIVSDRHKENTEYVPSEVEQKDFSFR